MPPVQPVRKDLLVSPVQRVQQVQLVIPELPVLPALLVQVVQVEQPVQRVRRVPRALLARQVPLELTATLLTASPVRRDRLVRRASEHNRAGKIGGQRPRGDDRRHGVRGVMEAVGEVEQKGQSHDRDEGADRPEPPVPAATGGALLLVVDPADRRDLLRTLRRPDRPQDRDGRVGEPDVRGLAADRGLSGQRRGRQTSGEIGCFRVSSRDRRRD